MLFGLGSRPVARFPESVEEQKALVDEGIELERALIAMDAVLDGQISTATKLICRDNHIFTKIAAGVLRFIEATVSFETDAIHRAVDALGASESAASAAKSRAHSSNISNTRFRAGAEFELAEYESSLLGAISMLLTEGKLDILRALYKIRKTYIALEELRKHVNSVKDGKGPNSPKSGNLSEFRDLHRQRTRQNAQNAEPSTEPTTEPTTEPSSTIEEYLLSGVDVMSGLLHLILSSVPPTIARLLSVVGLSGDRETALEMLWRAAGKYQNIHGSLALIALIMFFDSQLQYKDIQLSAEEEAEISERFKEASINGQTTKTTAKMTPKELRDTEQRLLSDLRRQRAYYPHGVLWMLQQGRLVAHRNLKQGVAILESDECGPNQMRQVEGLLMFDRTMFLLSLGRLKEASEQFLELKEVSTWSHPLYMYLAGACQLEMYRCGAGDVHKQLCNEYFERALTVGGKKKVLGRKMPFDSYVSRKVESFKHTAAKYNVSLADAVTTSPLYEGLYFWGGNSRMSPELAKEAVERLHYSATSSAKVPESESDAFTREVLEIAYLRCTTEKSGGYERAKKLADEVCSESRKKVHYQPRGEPWAGPAALYERAIYEWIEYGQSHAKQVRHWLSLSADWDVDYELSTRVSMKVTGARDRLDIYRL